MMRMVTMMRMLRMMTNPTKTATKEDCSNRFKGKFMTDLILSMMHMMSILVVHVFLWPFHTIVKDSYTTLLIVAKPDWSCIDAIFSTNSSDISSISLCHSKLWLHCMKQVSTSYSTNIWYKCPPYIVQSAAWSHHVLLNCLSELCPLFTLIIFTVIIISPS